jgi:hypothetical protein
MDQQEIQLRLDALSNAMTAAHLKQPAPCIILNPHADSCVMVRWGSYRDGDEAVNCFRAVDLADAFAEAEAFLTTIPSQSERERTEFLNAVGKAAELGRQYGIDAEFVNPLTEAMKRLSENALTHQGEVA